MTPLKEDFNLLDLILSYYLHNLTQAGVAILILQNNDWIRSICSWWANINAWQSKLQSTVAGSTMEAEYMAAFSAIQELIWIKGVLGEIGFDYVDLITLYEFSYLTHHKRSKHIDIKYYWLKEHTYKERGHNTLRTMWH